MSKTAVIYNSQTGFTKRYAGWISEALSCECFELKAVKNKDFKDYDRIIFGGWACAGSVSKIKWFKGKMKNWANKKLAVFCVGGSPNDNPELEKAMKSWFTEEEHKNVAVFYCQGGFDYDKMSLASRLMMKAFVSALKAKKDQSEEEKLMAEMISKSYDISDKKYIQPILEWAEK